MYSCEYIVTVCTQNCLWDVLTVHGPFSQISSHFDWSDPLLQIRSHIIIMSLSLVQVIYILCNIIYHHHKSNNDLNQIPWENKFIVYPPLFRKIHVGRYCYSRKGSMLSYLHYSTIVIMIIITRTMNLFPLTYIYKPNQHI